MEAADDWPDNEEIPREKVDTALQTLNEALTKERTRRLCGRSLRTATPNAFLCPTSTSSLVRKAVNSPLVHVFTAGGDDSSAPLGGFELGKLSRVS